MALNSYELKKLSDFLSKFNCFWSRILCCKVCTDQRGKFIYLLLGY